MISAFLGSDGPSTDRVVAKISTSRFERPETRDLSHRSAPLSLLASARASEWRRARGRPRMRSRTMTGADKLVCQAAALLLLFTLTLTPAKAQFGGGGGGQT